MTSVPTGAVLFMEGQPPSGPVVLCQGRVKLSVCSGDGKTLVLRIVEAGEVLGLAAAVSGKPYEATAETLEPCQVNSIERGGFARLMREHGELTLRVAEQLSETYNTACQEIRDLSRSAEGKLAKLLMEMLVRTEDARHRSRLTLSLTHEEIAQMIGTSRETVTRLFADFKKKQLIQQNGSTVIIRNRPVLETLIAAQQDALNQAGES